MYDKILVGTRLCVEYSIGCGDKTAIIKTNPRRKVSQ